ncbi:MAG: DUF4412 domain-containing protein [Hyphomonadaceae bacterium]
MRKIGLALAAGALLLAGCGQSGQTGQQQQAGAGGAFPQLFQASYRQEIQMTSEGRTGAMVMVRSGQNTRMEFTGDQGEMIMIVNPEAQEAYTIMPAQRRAMRVPLTQITQTPESLWTQSANDTAAAVTRVGPCNVAGESGNEWQRVDESGTHRGCVTNDGILLRATNGEEVVWETTSLQRGPQDPALFGPPAGYQVTDLEQMMQGLPNMQEMVEKYRAQTGQ